MRRLMLLVALTGCSAIADFDQFQPGEDGGVTGDGFVPPDAGPDLGPCEEGRPEDCNGVDDDCDELVDEGFDLTTLLNCGACDNVCVASSRAEPVCVDGACGIVCDDGFGDCDEDGLSCEVPLNTAANCGACGADCPEGQVCAETGGTFACADECPAGEIVCGSSCADLETDPSNCGSCGGECPEPPGAVAACVAFECGLGDCDTGFANCNGMPEDGCEVMTAFDPFNCGACDNACSFPNGIPSCSSSSCALAGCVSGFEDCDGDTVNGCEAQLGTVETCSGCTDACHEVINGSRSCGPSGCEYSCNIGFADCDGDITSATGNGCEAQLGTNAHCSMCDDACSGAQVCSDGACVATCGGGTPDLCSSGCTNVQSDPSNCGGCGNACPDVANSSPTCTSGSCGFACDPGFGDCSSSAAGCETSLDGVANCGSCGNDCANVFPNATVTCNSGTCAATGCQSGFADCDGPADCETPVDTVDDCGACDNECETANGTPACVNTAGGFSCAIGSCEMGFAQCDADLDCEPQEATFPDTDGDGFGDENASSILECPGASSRVPNDRDCDDGNPLINPNGTEVLNGEDDDCDNLVDEGLVTVEICNRADDDSDGFIDEGLFMATPVTNVVPVPNVTRLRVDRGGGAIGTAFYTANDIGFIVQTTPNQMVMPPPVVSDMGTISDDFDVCWDGQRFDVVFAGSNAIGNPQLRARRYAADGSLVRDLVLETSTTASFRNVRCARHPEGFLAVAYGEQPITAADTNVKVSVYAVGATALNHLGTASVISIGLTGLAIDANAAGFVGALSDDGGRIRTFTVSTTGGSAAPRSVDTDAAREVVQDLVGFAGGPDKVIVYDDGAPTYGLRVSGGGVLGTGVTQVQLSDDTPAFARDSGDGRLGIVRSSKGEVARYSVPALVDQAPREGPVTVAISRSDGEAVGWLGGDLRYTHYFFNTTHIRTQSVVCPSGTAP